MKNTELKKRNANKETGFTLVELMIAIVIFSIGLLAVSSMQVGAIKGNCTANGITQGATWAENQVERLIGLAYDDPELTDTDGDGTNQDADDDGDDDDGGNFGLDDDDTATADNFVTQEGYTVCWNVAENVIINNTKTVNIIVTWMECGAQKSVAIHRVVPRIT